MNSLTFFKKMYAHLILLVLMMCCIPVSNAAMAPTAMPQMSEAELKQLEQQMEAEINSFVSSLPPAQQDQFYKDVEALTQEMSKMSDEELTKFIESVFTEPTPSAPAPTPTPVAPTPTPIKPVKVEEPKKPKVSRKQVDELVVLLEEIADHIDNFIQKSEAIIDFPRKIEKWARAGFIPQWKNPDVLHWTEVQDIAIRLAQKIKSLMSRDPKTKEYRFIAKLSEDKALVNNLQLLNKKLNEESYIEVPEFDIPEQDGLKLKLRSKQAIRQTADAILEANSLLKIPEAINTMIAAFGPIAEKIKEEEEEAIKKAIDALRRPRIPATVRVIGSPEGEVATGPAYQGAQNYGYRVPSYSQYGAPPAAPVRRDTYEQARRERPSKPTEKKKYEDKKRPTKTTPQPESESEKRASGYIETIGSSLEQASDAISGITRHKDFAALMKKAPDSRKGQDIMDNLSEAQTAIKSATTTLGSFNTSIKSLPAPSKKRLTDQVKKAIKGPMDKIKKFKKQLEPIRDNLEKSFTVATKIPDLIARLERNVDRIGKR